MTTVKVYDDAGNPMTLLYCNNGYYLKHAKVAEIMEGMKEFEARKDDIWVTGFMKSGTTWLREIVGMLIRGDANYHNLTDLGNIELITPAAVKDLPSPRMLKMHMVPSIMPTVVNSGCKMMHIMRNPKDIAVSAYYYALYPHVMTEYEGSFHNYLSLFKKGAYFGLTWFDHVKEWWILNKERENVLILFYEELLQDPIKTIKEVAAFLEMSFSEEFYNEVALKTSFPNMSGAKRDEIVPNSEKLVKGTKACYFRKGVIGDWKTHFTKEESEEFDRLFASEMADVPDLRDRIQFE